LKHSSSCGAQRNKFILDLTLPSPTAYESFAFRYTKGKKESKGYHAGTLLGARSGNGKHHFCPPSSGRIIVIAPTRQQVKQKIECRSGPERKVNKIGSMYSKLCLYNFVLKIALFSIFSCNEYLLY
jgi:hypothetical protein